MIYPSIRIEGSIFSPDILDRLDDAAGQRPSDFGLEPSAKVKDEIARAWADAQDYWRIFQRKLETLKPDSPATTETRQQWIVPLMGLLGYQLEYQSRGVELNGKIYAISHRTINRGQTPVHIVGYREPAGLDRKPEKAALRMSAHAMLQEYLNLQEELYGIVTNGRVLRLLRDSSRLIKLTYLEFDLDRIFTDGLFADFAVLYRLLHVSRLPVALDAGADSLIERYHQDSLDSGARIREGLSKAVEEAILDFANGFLSHPANDDLRRKVSSGELSPDTFYQQMLRLIYRLLFLMVIEERDLIFPPKTDTKKRNIYYSYYSLQRLRRMSEKRYLADRRRHDLWLSLLSTFRLFEAGGPGQKLGVAALAGDLFNPQAINLLGGCALGNDVVLKSLRSLGLYQHPDTKQLIRVNYAALNVEEFGSVYEGLLEYQPTFHTDDGKVAFAFVQGDERSNTGSHYTPDDLVQPLIRNSLDYLIADKLKEADPQKALLSLRVADIACGSGHILLAAARRIATELAIIRTGEDQPSPSALRAAVRDVIRECIYGVDLNPLAVELCKVALWLEAHIPGEPLNFLDHHIKCGNAIVGFARREEVERGVPEEAFKTLAGDDKETAGILRKRNKAERSAKNQKPFDFEKDAGEQYGEMLQHWRSITKLPERTPEEIEEKKRRFLDHMQSKNSWWLQQLASIPIAQFYIPKTPDNEKKIITDADFRLYWSGQRLAQGQTIATTVDVASRKRFFHWFLEFPDIIENGGFDCILGNPPYLGGQALSGSYGHNFCEYSKWEYAPTGLSDLVAFFVRRIFALLKPGGFTAIIATSSIKDGDVRKDGLEQILINGGSINFAIRSIKWPGRAKLLVSLISIFNGKWDKQRFLDQKNVLFISSYLDNAEDLGSPKNIPANTGRMYVGSYYLGDGFLLTKEQASQIISEDPSSSEVIYPALNGMELNNRPDQSPERFIINFSDWPIERAENFSGAFNYVFEHVKPERDLHPEVGPRTNWWLFKRPTAELYRKISDLSRCFVIGQTSKHHAFSALSTSYVFLQTCYVFTTDQWWEYSVVQSNLHAVWAVKYSGALGATQRYMPRECFQTFPFPEISQEQKETIDSIGEKYHEYRSDLMKKLFVGLTDIYNLFHESNLTPTTVEKVSKKTFLEAEEGCKRILELRKLHREMDIAVRDAYGWSDLDLAHGFYEIETLPENDRVRYTISPDARKEVLKRLLALNHERAAQEEAAAPVKVTKGKKKKVKERQPQPVTVSPGAWARPMSNLNFEAGAMLTALLKALDGPTPSRTIRLAAVLALEPRFLLPYLDLAEAAEWRNNVGSQADPLPGTVPFTQRIDNAWGDRVRHLRINGRLIENLQDNTWAPGMGLDNIDTAGWPDGRARFVLDVLRRQSIDIDHVIEELPDNVYQLFEYAEAA